jgi:hypothetical protein
MDKRSVIFILILAITMASAVAQQPSTQLRTVERGQRYGSDKIICYVDAHQTNIEILGLFKPDEIVMQRDFNADVPEDMMVMRLQVKDKNHAVLKYFKHQAELYFEGRYYEHNVIPEINAARVQSLEFEPSDYSTSGYVLKVNLFGEEYKPDQNISFSTERKQPKYADYDGKLMSIEEFKQLNLKMGSFKTETVLYGKMATDKYGDAKYAEGVMVVISIKN